MLPKGKEQQMAERVRAVNALLLQSCFFSTQRQVRATRVRVRARVRGRVRGSPALLHPAPGGLLRLGLGVGLGLGLPLTLTPTPTPTLNQGCSSSRLTTASAFPSSPR